ncbi:MAG: Na/Pi symporter [Bacteroidia bacterium]|nr:Na/Pi symporter [Bacteroidia bacterium]
MNKNEEISSYTTGNTEDSGLDAHVLETASGGKSQIAFTILKLLGAIYIFLVSLKLMSAGLGLLGGKIAENLLSITTFPFIALFIGILATAIIQSSSTITTIIVALVASGEISLANAIPMIMGANIGTAVTSTIVSLGHIGNRDEFEGAVSGASVHDFFNILIVVILLPLELFTGFLEKSSLLFASWFEIKNGIVFTDSLSLLTKSSEWILALFNNNPYMGLFGGVLLLFISLRLLTYILKNLLVGVREQNMNKYVFGRPFRSLLMGFLTTAAIQSSSVTSSLMVPLVATRKVSLERAFNFLMGANIGTTSTVIIAALFLGMEGGASALACAFVHLLFNLFGVFLLFPFEKLRTLPVNLAKGLGKYARKSRFYGIAYVISVFFIIPFILIAITTDFL